MMVRTYGFPGGLTRPTGDLDSQPLPRTDHVEAWRPRESYATQSSHQTASRPLVGLSPERHTRSLMERHPDWLPPVAQRPATEPEATPPAVAPATPAGPFEPPRPSLLRRAWS